MAEAKKLRVEYFKDPIGLDVEKPRFSWIIDDSRRGAGQSAYQIIVRKANETVWDSGKVASDSTIHVEYNGKKLEPRTPYAWKVRLWDERGSAGEESAESTFETGLLGESAWSAEWISAEVPVSDGELPSVPILRRTFTIEKEFSRARLYATALGLYEMRCNGGRIGDAYFTPGFTDYNTRVQYQAYDVTGMIVKGVNALAALMGTGWYGGEITGGYWAGKELRRPALKAMLIVDYADGSSERISTDGFWKWAPSPISWSDIYMGESYDARNEIPGWDTASCDETGWRSVKAVAPACGAIVAQRGPVVRKTQTIRPVSVKEISSGVYIVNMGQNMVGWVALKVKGPSGSLVKIRHAERLNPDGTLYTANYRRAKALALYTCAGTGDWETWEPHFTFYGFQFLEVTGYPGTLDAGKITGMVLHSDMERSGSFSCSDDQVNQLYRNIVWGQRGNYLDIPTDCPQRDERLGWTGDAQVFVRTATYNYDIGGFFTKWLYDLNDAQAADGRYPHFAPRLSDLGGGGAAWADAGIICPWVLYNVYGDTRILETHYDKMKYWMSYLERYGNDDIKNNAWFGDWLSINADTPKEIIGTAFFAHTANLMSKIASVLGKTDDSRHYAGLFERIKKSFNDEFITPNGRITGNTQTAYILALQFDLLPEKKRIPALRYLVEDIRGRKHKLSCGFVGSPYLNLVLSRFERNDIAYHLLHQTEWPSWLYAVTKGATTIWERWDGWTEDKGFADAGMNSFNHYAYGAIGEWLFRVVAGLDMDESAPAYKRILIAPRAGGKLWYANAQYDSIRGTISVAWDIVHETVYALRIKIPANTTARVRMPASDQSSITENGIKLAQVEGVSNVVRQDGAVWFDLQAGTYRFETPYKPC